MAGKQMVSGCLVALVTPFLSDGRIDWTRLRDLVEFQISEGIDGLIPCGTTGESPTLTFEEQGEIVRAVKEHAKGRVPVIAGAGSNSTHHAIELVKQAEAGGADGILSVAPYYNKPTQEGFFRHYEAISRVTRLPIILYNVPGRTGGNIEPATVWRLAEIPNIVGLKEASGQIGQIMELLRNRPADFSVLSGDDALAFPMLALGGQGVISVVANEVPRLFSTLVHAGLQGDWAKALALHNRLLPLMNLNFIESNPIPVKAALALMGKIEAHYRLPLCSLRAENRAKLQQALREVELI
ncbi:MAG: 4-hydroxy-tetrahydrodipicolinate synthase [Acidobacteria bacterium]|nr:4-hydroxy-tetrahydrodipicolinate synthase [Acidobacteriota bacterium]